MMLNKGGKRIDMNHQQKQTTVASHIINENSQEPIKLEKGIYKTNGERPLGLGVMQYKDSNVKIGHAARSSSGARLNRPSYGGSAG